MIIFKVFK